MRGIIREYIRDNYGSNRGLLRFARECFLSGAGAYRRWSTIDWARVERLVFVCKGNICRSPLGALSAGQAGVATVSYGLDCTEGAPADPRAVRYAEAIGLDLSGHRTRHIGGWKAAAGDLVVAFEPAHLAALNGRLQDSSAQVTLAGLWLSRPRAYIHDPFNTNDEYFRKCETTVVSASAQLTQAMRSSRM